MAALIELPILGLLQEGPLYGYELKRRLESFVGFFGTVSYGSIYPMLRTLERRGQITQTSEVERGLNRFVYRMTAKGGKRFVQLMHDPSTPLAQKLLFFEAIPPVDRRQILETHKEEWLRRAERYRHQQEQIDTRHVDRYRVSLLNREVESLEKDIIWLQALIDDEMTEAEPVQNKQYRNHKSLKSSRKRR